MKYAWISINMEKEVFKLFISSSAEFLIKKQILFLYSVFWLVYYLSSQSDFVHRV